MIVPAYLPYYVVTGAIGTIAAILFGLSKALSKSDWGGNLMVRPINRSATGCRLITTSRGRPAPIINPARGKIEARSAAGLQVQPALS
jgi:hypothetical protein